jgi:small-conductance mechanosensitive channel
MKTVNNTLKNQTQRIEVLEKNIENISMALRVNQLLLKQVIDQLQPMQSELKNNTGMLNDFQYRVLGLQKCLPVDAQQLAAIVDDMKLDHWQEASDKDDVSNKLENKNTVSSKEDIVIITSTVLNDVPSSGIFRSKIKLEEAGVELTNALLEKQVGDTVEVKLNNEMHKITLLGVRVKTVE